MNMSTHILKFSIYLNIYLNILISVDLIYIKKIQCILASEETCLVKVNILSKKIGSKLKINDHCTK